MLLPYLQQKWRGYRVISLRSDHCHSTFIYPERSPYDEELFTGKQCLSISQCIHYGQLSLTCIWNTRTKWSCMVCCGQHPWAKKKQLNSLFRSWCVTLSSMPLEIPNTAGIAPESQRDCFSIKSRVTLDLCFYLSFVTTPAMAQCVLEWSVTVTSRF